MDKTKIKTLQDLVTAAAAEHGDSIFITEKGAAPDSLSEKSFKQFEHDCRCVMSWINSVRKSSPLHAAVIGPSSYAWLVGYFSAVMGGDAAVPLDALMGAEDIAELLNRSDSEIFFYDKKYEKMIPLLREKCPAVAEFISSEEIMKLAEEYSPAELPTVEPSALAAISYTSGTTGKSKGVMLLNSNLIDNAMCQDNESTPEDVVMSVLPIHHIYCFTCDILCSLRYGNRLCLNDSMLRIARNLQVYRPTIMLIVPMIAETIYKQIKAAAAQNPNVPIKMIADKVFGGRLRTIFSGGAYLRPELQKAYIDMGYQMGQGYGMTECSPRISTADRYDTSCRGDVGVVVNGCDVKIVDGEITVKSPSVMAGYYKDEEATKEAFTEDGYLRTGDLGYVDKDNHIFITGRKKNLIILSNGENVSPEELENKFSGADIISEVMVYTEDELICAEIFPNKEYADTLPDPNAEIKALVDKINKTMPSSKAIHRIRVRTVEFDKTTSKKIIRNQSQKGEIIG